MRKIVLGLVLVGILFAVVYPCFAAEDLEKKITDLTTGVRNIAFALIVLAIVVAGVARLFFGNMQIFWAAITGAGIILAATAIFEFLKKYLQ